MRAQAPDRLARVVLGEHLRVRPRETVTIDAWSHALPWARALVLEARCRGAEPILALEDEETFFRALDVPRGRALPSPPASLAAASDALVYLPGPEEFPRLLGLAPGERRELLRRYGPAWTAAARRARARAVRLAISSATPLAATRYGIEAEAWQAELLAASSVSPQRLEEIGRPLGRRLGAARRLRIRHPNGTDLTIERSRGPVRVQDGRPDRTVVGGPASVPGGRVVAFVRRGGARGTWEANRAAYDRFAEDPVQLGGRFRFSEGRLREFEFDRGGPSFAAEYSLGGHGRDRLGAISFGVNPRIARAPEVADLAAGAVSLWLGDLREVGGAARSAFSRVSTLAEADVELDGRPWLLGGRPVG